MKSWLLRLRHTKNPSLVVGVAFFGVFFTLGLFLNSNLFRVRQFDIEVKNFGTEWNGGRLALEGKLMPELQSFFGRYIWEIKIEELHAKLKEQEWIDDLTISRSFPARVRISFAPKKLIFLLQDGPLLRPVGQRGELLKQIRPEEVSDLPLLLGKIFQDQGLRQKAIEFFFQLPVRGGLSQENVSDLTYDANKGFSLTLMKPSATVILGDEKIDSKMNRVEAVLDYMQLHNLSGRVIDATYSKKVLVRLRKVP